MTGGATTPADMPPATPVLVGIGTASRREEDFRRALEPIDLMLEAVTAAATDAGSACVCAGAQYIAVPQGRWSYANPAGEIARHFGAAGATTVLASVGVLQQTLIGEACRRIASGEIHTALVAGADAGYRLRRAQIANTPAPERQLNGAPDIVLKPAEELRHPVELRAGLHMPVGLYAIIENAWRARQGLTLEAHRDHLAHICAGFSRVAAGNPLAWQRDTLDAASIREPSARNPLQAFPYNRAHCANWNVDQAAALLICSASRATALNIPPARWIFPLVSAESNHMVPVSARVDLSACPAASLVSTAALTATGLRPEQIDIVDLYSCFPVAVSIFAEALGLPPGRDLTVTGGMGFAGGPYNNYVLQATCRAVSLLRQGKGRTALLSSVSGVLTKQAVALWSVAAPPRGFMRIDVSADAAHHTATREVVADYTGPAQVAGYTVLAGRESAPRGIALVDTAHGARAIATTEEPQLITAMQHQEFVGRTVRIAASSLLA